MARLVVLLLLFGLAGCRVAPEPIRSTGGDLWPALVEAPTLDVSRLAKTDDCLECHRDVGSQWLHSAHAYASFDNPWYRASVDTFRASRGKKQSRFCAGCHDPLLLLSGAIDGEVTAQDQLAYAGITCLICHSIESVRSDGNGSYTLTDTAVLIPDPSSPDEIAAHRARLSPTPLRSGVLCGSCHRSFSGPAIGNGNHLPGIDDFGEWTSSTFSGAIPDQLVSTERLDCQGCHMGSERASDAEMSGAHDGVIRTHRWAASHTALASQLQDPRHLAQAVEALVGAVTVDVGAVRSGTERFLVPQRAEVRGGERVVFDVLLQNERVGHRFPGGVRDLHDTWLEVSVRDATGRVLGVSRPDGDGRQDVFLLRATMLDEHGNPELLHRVHRFEAPAFDRTLEPHDARAVRYSMVLPRSLELPLRVDARLLHRKHGPELQAFACAASRTERGRAFAIGAERRGKVAVDPCVDQPVTEVGRAAVWLGRGAFAHSPEGGASRPMVERMLTQGLALLHEKQEHVDLAAPSIEYARRLARREGSKSLEARALALKARLAAISGRPDRASSILERAEAMVGSQPEFARLRADAYARVWRWSQAVDSYERLVVAAPDDFRAWRSLARAYGSLQDDRNALRAADEGLRLAPRDEDLLRSRALALDSMGDPRAGDAWLAWIAHRTPDVQPSLLSRCEQAHQRCRRDRQPIPHYTLAPPRKAVHASLDPG